MSFSIDEYHSKSLWATANASSIDIGLQEKDFTVANEKKREIMWKIRDSILNDLNRQFPYLSQNSEENM